jgi:hypothetical protein
MSNAIVVMSHNLSMSVKRMAKLWVATFASLTIPLHARSNTNE